MRTRDKQRTRKHNKLKTKSKQIKDQYPISKPEDKSPNITRPETLLEKIKTSSDYAARYEGAKRNPDKMSINWSGFGDTLGRIIPERPFKIRTKTKPKRHKRWGKI